AGATPVVAVRSKLESTRAAISPASQRVPLPAMTRLAGLVICAAGDPNARLLIPALHKASPMLFRDGIAALAKYRNRRKVDQDSDYPKQLMQGGRRNTAPAVFRGPVYILADRSAPACNGAYWAAPRACGRPWTCFRYSV